jgi:nucleoside-diphosphate-sugar epimerase
MKSFLTGATGFLGGRILGQLLDEGMEVRCLVRTDDAADRLRGAAGPGRVDRLEFVRGSLGRINGSDGLLEGCDVVYHAASSLSGAAAGLFANNVVAMRRLVEACGRSGVKRLVLVSSMGVYGTGHLRSGGVVDEQCPLDPAPHLRDPYTYSKVAQEEVAWEAFREGGLPLAVVRPGNIFGPGRDPVTARVGLRVGNFVLRMGGRQAMPYTYVENCARAVLLAGTVPGVEGEAFNVVDDDLPTGRWLLKRYRREVGRLPALGVPRWAIQPLSRSWEWYHRWSHGQLPAVLTRYKSAAMWKPLRYSNAKAKARLGWEPTVGMEEGMRLTFAWLREHAGPVGQLRD